MNRQELAVDYDGLWKGLIEEFFTDFIDFFVPELKEYVDLEKGYDFLEQELRKLFQDSEMGKRYTDKLVKLHLKGGGEKWLLIHIEIQGSKEEGFAKRMFQYFYRIYDKYDQEIYAIALLTDDDLKFRPLKFDYKLLDTELSYKYRTYKILDQSETELMESDNPFAMAILAGLYLIKTKKGKEIEQGFKYKVSLAKLLFKKKWAKEKIENLLQFIEQILKLPKDIEEKFIQEVQNSIKEVDEMGNTLKKSIIIDSWRQEGWQEGRQEERLSIARELILSGTELAFVSKITKLSMDELKELKKSIGD